MFLRVALFAFTALLAAGCAGQNRGASPNTLSSAEQRAGWELLFNGRDTSGWRGFGRDSFPASGWVVEDGWLRHLPKGGGGDIITTRTFRNFELAWEWKVAPGGNSGLKYFISEARKAPIGHEYQLIDDSLHPDAGHGPKRQTASLYDALPPVDPPVRPAGLVNTSRVVVRGDDVEHWLNGRRVLAYRLGEALSEAKAASKFRSEARWGTGFATPILLQDHSDEVAFRSIKIRVLP